MLKKLLVRLLRRKSADVGICQRARSVLIRPAGSALGDAVVLTASLAQLKEVLPDVKIGILVNDRNREIFSFCPLVDALINDRFSEVWRQRNKWDVFIEYTPVFRSRWIWYCYLLHSHFSIAFAKKPKSNYTMDNVHVYDCYCPQAVDYHINQWLTLTPFGVDNTARYVLDKPKCTNPYPDDKKLHILLTPYGTSRKLDPHIFAQAIAANNSPSVSFYLLNQPQAVEYMHACKQYAPQADVRWGDSPTLQDFLAYVYYADAVVSIDSVAVHLCGAYERPLLALYANFMQNVRYIGPLAQPQTELLLSDKVATNNDDFSSFSADTIAAGIRRLIARVSVK